MQERISALQTRNLVGAVMSFCMVAFYGPGMRAENTLKATYFLHSCPVDRSFFQYPLPQNYSIFPFQVGEDKWACIIVTE